jgi:fructokinase
MEHWGMQQTLVTKHATLPTGRVQVTLEDNEPSYDIVTDVAYDTLLFDALSEAIDLAATEIVYHGSLCFRTEHNRDFLRQVLNASAGDRFVDLNLRPPWIQRDQIEDLIANARWVKLNADELEWLSEIAVDQQDVNSVQAAIAALADTASFSLPNSWLATCGEHGAYWIATGEKPMFEPTIPANPFADPVGAGDAFSAAILYGILNGHSRQQTLRDAVRFAATACALQGATTTERGHYDAAIAGLG